jgi:hypothetical protein
MAGIWIISISAKKIAEDQSAADGIYKNQDFSIVCDYPIRQAEN